MIAANRALLKGVQNCSYYNFCHSSLRRSEDNLLNFSTCLPGHYFGGKNLLNALEKELLTVKSDYVKNCRLLECLHQGQALKENVFYGESSNTHKSLDRTFSGKGFSDICGPLTETDTSRQLSQHSEICGELLRELKEIKTIRSDLLSVKRERRELQQQSREIMKVVQDSKRSQTPTDSIDNDADDNGSTGGADGRRQLCRAENELCLLRGTLQGLIAGSGVRWSQNNQLLELTLKLGDDKQWR